MQRGSVAVLLLASMALAMGGVAQGEPGEQGWNHLQQYWGQVQSLQIDRCGQRPGLCEGTVVLTPRCGREVALSMRPGMWIKRGIASCTWRSCGWATRSMCKPSRRPEASHRRKAPTKFALLAGDDKVFP
jgi:hypothetical protein